MVKWFTRWLRRESTAAGGRLLALAILCGFLAIRVADPPVVEELRLRTFDFYQTFALRPRPQQPVIIVDVNEESLKAMGQWPWPRTRIADLIANIAKAGAVAVAFDIVFPEPDRTSPAQIAGEIRGLDPEMRAKLEKLESNVLALARAFKLIRVIVAQSGQGKPANDNSAAPVTETPIGIMGTDPSPFIVTFPGLLQNVPELEVAAAGHGLFTIRAEADGIVRRVPVIM